MRHRLTDVLLIAFAASLSGAQACSDMALFARSKLEVLRRLVPLPHGPPGQDTFSRVVRLPDPEAFEAVVGRDQGVATPLRGRGRGPMLSFGG